MARRGSTAELAALLASLDLSAFLPAFVEDKAAAPAAAKPASKQRARKPAAGAGRGRGGKARGGRKADAGASSTVTPKFSPVAADTPAPASFAAVVAAPAPAREHKSS